MHCQARFCSLYICVGIIVARKAESLDSFNAWFVTGQKLTDIIGISFDRCKEECNSRRSCDSANYVRKRLLCELNMDIRNGGTRVDLRPGYVHYRKGSTNQDYSGCSCSVNEKCIVSESGTTSCSLEECETPYYPGTMTRVSGNMNGVGSKSTVECKSKWRASVELKTTRFVIECDKHGQWDGCDERKCGKEVFRAKKGIGRLRSAWRGKSTFTNDTSCRKMRSENTACDLHFRDDDIDQWESLNIARVLLSVYKNEEEVHFVLFNGTGTTSASWFSQDNILHSSWQDITTVPANYFSIEGHHRSDDSCRILRRFYMSTMSNGCEGDAGWLVWTFPYDKPACCDWEAPEDVADIIYSTGITFAVFDNRSLVGRADFFTVVIFSN